VSTDRLDVFSDGVFAIAITLLALDLPRPHGDDVWHALAHSWESYASFIISFLTIGIIWLNHQALFDRIARADRTLNMLNVLLLMWIAIIPWPTGLVADHLSGDGATAATAIYCAVFAAMAATFSAVWHYARAAGHLAELTEAQVAHLGVRNSLGIGFYLAAAAIAFVLPLLSLGICLALGVYYVLPDRADELMA
jgi:TMEM175 potassium channel family protein